MTTGNDACLTFKGASVRGTVSIFGPRIYYAIDKSQLREWEKDHQILDTTDCVTMMMLREPPYHCTIRLRIGFVAGIHIVNSLYAEAGTS